MADYDLAIIGGGLNGVSIARDAAGRGLRVILLEQGDLGARRFLGHAAADPWRSGGAGAARTSFASAPRSPSATSGSGSRRIWCVRCALPSPPIPTSARPGSCGRGCCSTTGSPRAAACRPPRPSTSPIIRSAIALKRPFGTAFEYSDCVVDNSRLVVLTAVDAAARGAVIRTGARCTRAERGETWRLVTIDRGHRQVVTARALVNATGAWTAIVAETVLRVPPPNAAAAAPCR